MCQYPHSKSLSLLLTSFLGQNNLGLKTDLKNSCKKFHFHSSHINIHVIFQTDSVTKCTLKLNKRLMFIMNTINIIY